MDKTIHSRDYAVFLNLLRAARERAGLTQEEVASKLNETQSFVSKCERGERRLDIVEIRLWCMALNISLCELMKKFDEACTSLKPFKRSIAD